MHLCFCGFHRENYIILVHGLPTADRAGALHVSAPSVEVALPRAPGGGSSLRSQSTPYVSPRRHSRAPGSATSTRKADRHSVMNSPTEVDIISFGGNQRDQCDGCPLN
jgi:hypothetical protein